MYSVSTDGYCTCGARLLGPGSRRESRAVSTHDCGSADTIDIWLAMTCPRGSTVVIALGPWTTNMNQQTSISCCTAVHALWLMELVLQIFLGRFVAIPSAVHGCVDLAAHQAVPKHPAVPSEGIPDFESNTSWVSRAELLALLCQILGPPLEKACLAPVIAPVIQCVITCTCCRLHADLPVRAQLFAIWASAKASQGRTVAASRVRAWGASLTLASSLASEPTVANATATIGAAAAVGGTH